VKSVRGLKIKLLFSKANNCSYLQKNQGNDDGDDKFHIILVTVWEEEWKVLPISLEKVRLKVQTWGSHSDAAEVSSLLGLWRSVLIRTPFLDKNHLVVLRNEKGIINPVKTQQYI